MSEPLLSIITVTRNNARGLKLTAKSLRVQQQAPAYEWLIIDGASDDDTATIADQFANDSTYFLSEPDQGKFDAMNKALVHTTGRYVWFLNAGDCLPDAYVLRDIMRHIQYHLAPDIIYGDTRANGRIHKARHAGHYGWGMATPLCAMLFRRQAFSEQRFDIHYPLAADYAFFLEALAKARKSSAISRLLCDRLWQPKPWTQYVALLQEQFRIRKELLRTFVIKNQAILTLKKIGALLPARRSF